MRFQIVLTAYFLCLAAVAVGSCPEYRDGVVTGFPQNTALREISGLAASRTQADIFWTHNDSGDGPYLYALNTSGTTLGRVELKDAQAVDWEDLTGY